MMLFKNMKAMVHSVDGDIGWLVLNSISTLVGYLMPDLIY